MSGSALPGLIDALVAQTATWPALNVSDGLPAELASGDWLAIGVDDYDESRTKASAGTSTEEWAGSTIDSGIDEVGSITCVAWSQNGNGSQKAARDAVYAIHAALRSWLLSQLTGNPNALGVTGLWDVRVGGVDELNQHQDANGAAAVIRFSVAYQARI